VGFGSPVERREFGRGFLGGVEHEGEGLADFRRSGGIIDLPSGFLFSGEKR
jgi:hypothetical protein